jgi:TPR repeat protein
MAAEAGMPLAQYNLGTLYEEGNGVEKDPATALIWYHLAANQGDVLAQYRMGVLYAEGRGTERHDVMAYYWLTLAAFHSGDVVLREDALALRKEVARRMNGKQIAAAEAMARDWRVSR